MNTALSLAGVYTQFIVLLMATLAQQERENWDDEAETTAFVEYLWEHRSEGGDGGTFKDVTMRAAAEHIADKRTMGPIKLVKHCKIKYSAVSHRPC